MPLLVGLWVDHDVEHEGGGVALPPENIHLIPRWPEQALRAVLLLLPTLLVSRAGGRPRAEPWAGNNCLVTSFHGDGHGEADDGSVG